MIVRERDESYVFITQHDHAQYSGVMAEYWSREGFPNLERREEILLAIYQHDLGWQDLDFAPFWNDKKQAPYSFLDFPLAPKLIHYKHGIDLVEKQSPYAALLCSIHYCSFAHLSKHEAARSFIKEEKKRQHEIIRDFDLSEHFDQIYAELRFLKVFDRLSLYLCMNEPGVEKADEVESFMDGIKDSEYFISNEGKPLGTYWKDTQHVVVTPFPFTQTVKIAMNYKEIFKEDIKAKGVREAFLEGEWQCHKVWLISK